MDSRLVLTAVLSAAPYGMPPAIKLLQRCNIRRKVCRFRPRELHVRHFRVRLEQEERKFSAIEVRVRCYGREWGGLARRTTLIRRHDMTR